MFSTLTESSADGMVHVLGVRFHCFTRKQAVEQMMHWIHEKSSRMVITAGPEFVMMTQSDAELAHITYVADLVTPDGIGVVWAGKRAGNPNIERVTGVEVVRELLDTAEQRNQPLRVYVLGASEVSLARCLDVLQDAYPNCSFKGRNGYFREEDVPDILEDVAAFKPDVWLVGLGQPRQEKFIYENLKVLPPCVAIGVGGSIDVWGGTVKRAPEVFQRFNLEWMYRLVTQPSRLRRQLVLPRFAWKVLRTSPRKS